MTYVFLVAGKGTRLHPITLSYPKSLFKLDKDTTVIERMVALIKKYDAQAKIVAVTGFMHREIEQLIPDITYVFNPFYEVTNSLASLWLAKEHLQGDVVLINGDVVMSEELVRDVICKKPTGPVVLVDGSIKKDGDYNVQVHGDHVVVMSKNLDKYYGEYAGILKLDPASLTPYLKELDNMMEKGMYDQWYEDVMVQMIFKDNYPLGYEDIAAYDWTEIDCVSDLTIAKKIQSDFDK